MALPQPNHSNVDLGNYPVSTPRPRRWGGSGSLFGNYWIGDWLWDALAGGAQRGQGRGFHPFARNNVDIFGRYIGPPMTGQGTLAPTSPTRVPGVVDPRAALVKPERGLGVSPHGETPSQDRMRRLLEQTGGVAGNTLAGPDLFRGLDRMSFFDLLRGENAAAPARRQPQIDAWNRSQVTGGNAPRSANVAGQGQYLGSNWGVPQFGPVGGGGPMPVPTFAERTANGTVPPGYMSADEAQRLGFMTPGGGAKAAFYPKGMPYGWTPGSPVPLPQRKRY